MYRWGGRWEKSFAKDEKMEKGERRDEQKKKETNFFVVGAGNNNECVGGVYRCCAGRL